MIILIKFNSQDRGSVALNPKIANSFPIRHNLCLAKISNAISSSSFSAAVDISDGKMEDKGLNRRLNYLASYLKIKFLKKGVLR